MFILPRHVIHIVNSICRSFLWFGTHDSHKPSHVNWDAICKPKKAGGLGIRNLQVWNAAAVGKIAWHIFHLRESLWVKWVHGVYTKRGRWEIFNAPITASWTLKKICAVKDQLLPWICKDHYSLHATYMACIDSHIKVGWVNIIWNRLSIPKTRFICWMATLQKLKTKDKLFHISKLDNDLFPLCGIWSESNTHLFFERTFSQQCLQEIKSWSRVRFKPFRRMDF